MNGWQEDVRDFHEAMGHPAGGDSPQWVDPERLLNRMKWTMDEVREGYDALALGDLPEFVDAQLDIIYFCCGTLVELGVDAQPLWEEVQRANMAKSGGPVQADGKRGKPPGWTPPDIAGELRKQGWQG